MMDTIDIIIVCAFLLATLLAGLGHGKTINNIKDYALGGQNFSTGALVSTIVATWVSGSSFFVTLNHTFSDGLYYLLPSLGMMFSLLITAYIFVPRMQSFLGKTSVAEVMGKLYGEPIRIIVALTGLFVSVGMVAVQFKALGNIFSYFFDTSKIVMVIISGMIVIIYSAFGGIRSVTYTDILQYLGFSIAIPIVAVIIWDHCNSVPNFSVLDAMKHEKFNYKKVIDFGNPEFLKILPLMFYFSIPGLSPVICQRIHIGNNIEQVKKAFAISAFIVIFMKLVMAWIPFLIFSLNPDLKPDELMGFIINNYTFTGLKGIILMSILALAMSTADSHINSASVLFANDICNFRSRYFKNKLLVAKIFAFTLGGFSIVLAISAKNFFDIILTAKSYYIPIVTSPLMLTIFGFRTTTKSVLVGMFAGLVTVIIWKIFDIKVNVITFAMLINAFFMISTHYFFKQDGGWVNTKQKQKTHIKKIDDPSWSSSFIKNVKISYPKDELTYVAFGIYCIIISLTTMYSTQASLVKSYGQIILNIYQIMIVTGTTFTLYLIWPKSVNNEIKQRIVKIIWPIAVFYMLIFFSGFFVLLSDFSSLQFVLFSVNILIAVSLIGWKLSIPAMIIGFYLSVEFFKFYTGVNHVDLNLGSPGFVLMYVLILVGSSIFLFFKPQQEHLEATEKRVTYLESELDTAHGQFNDVQGSMQLLQKQFEEKEGTLKEKEKFLLDQLKIRSEEVSKLSDVKDEFIRNLTHESNTPMTSILSLSDILYTYYDKLDKAEIKQSIKDIVKGGERLQTYINSITDLSKLSSLDYKLKREEVNLSQLVKERPFLYKKLFSDECEQQSFVFDVQPDISVNCDKYYITQVLDNLISNAVKYGMGNPVRISLSQNEQGKVSFEIRDEGIGIPNGELISIFDKFTVSSKTTSPAEGRGVGLALVHKIITMHGGRIWAESDGKSWSVFRFAL